MGISIPGLQDTYLHCPFKLELMTNTWRAFVAICEAVMQVAFKVSRRCAPLDRDSLMMIVFDAIVDGVPGSC